MKRIFYILAVVLSIVASCREEIDESNRYTFTGETVADYLLHRSEKYSHMITLMKRANLFGLLATYGQYTLFLPDNDGVEKFIYEQDSIYHASKDSGKPVWTGVTSPYIEDLSDSMANFIARTHVTEVLTRTFEMGDGSLPERNFNYRLLGVNYVAKGEQYYIMINNSAAIINADNNVENGVIHHVDKVITPSDKNVPGLIESYSFFGLFTEAMNRTEFCDSLLLYNDESYNYEEYSITNAILGNVTAPKTKFYKYTAFIETDDVFHENGIYTIDDLVAFAEKWYGTKEKDNFKNPNNALYKFVSYHFVPRELPHNKIVPYDLLNYAYDFDKHMPTLYDRYDYFETMQGTLMKVVKPLSKTEGSDTYINYNKRDTPYNMELYPHLNIRVIPLTEFVQMKQEYSQFDQMANNGILHPIDKILVYNEDEMFGNILNERIRIDVASLIPELSCNNLRFNGSIIRNIIPDVYSEKINIKNGTLYYLCNSFGSYNLDKFILDDYFDVEFTLPPLPPHIYEVRVGFSQTSAATSDVVTLPEKLCQIYIDGKPEGVPFNIYYLDRCPGRMESQTGYIADLETFDNGLANDKNMRLIGWMKAPVTFYFRELPARNFEYFIRKIITRKHFNTGKHKIRFRIVGNYDSDLDLDYIEFVPLNIISDPSKPEDRH
ncbi:MAG: fasciclin domain-containing protein [Bacteroidaceae bacterium]|nr:fasciclin domain-containing protein [Bacteroidaceae bacterium]